jgi:hypothetical protein
MTCTLFENQYTFVTITRSFFLQWEMSQTKVVDKIENTCSVSYNFSPNSCPWWENVEKYEPVRPQMTKRHTRFACWIPTATETHSEYAILTDFPLQQWLQERASILRSTYIACLVCTKLQHLLWISEESKKNIYLLTYSMEQSPSWEDNCFSASQEIPHILWNP